MGPGDATPLLEARGIATSFDLGAGRPGFAVDGIDLDVQAGETVALVGESGCGKSVFAYSLLRLIKPPGRIERGQVRLDGRDLLGLDERALLAVRGGQVGMIFQEPSTSLNPLLRVGAQVAESLLLHRAADRRSAPDRVVELFRMVGIPAPEARIRSYPHELSGGMRQRVMIAMALACGPRLLIADEPTTALDVTIQAQVLDLIDDMRERLGMGVLLITHDLGVVAQWSDRVAVLYAGRKVEEGPTREVLDSPRHPYTQALLRARPQIRDPNAPLVEIPGTVPLLAEIPPGCAFADRCSHVRDACRRERPALRHVGRAHAAACILAEDLVAA